MRIGRTLPLFESFAEVLLLEDPPDQGVGPRGERLLENARRVAGTVAPASRGQRHARGEQFESVATVAVSGPVAPTRIESTWSLCDERGDHPLIAEPLGGAARQARPEPQVVAQHQAVLIDMLEGQEGRDGQMGIDGDGGNLDGLERHRPLGGVATDECQHPRTRQDPLALGAWEQQVDGDLLADPCGFDPPASQRGGDEVRDLRSRPGVGVPWSRRRRGDSLRTSFDPEMELSAGPDRVQDHAGNRSS